MPSRLAAVQGWLLGLPSMRSHVLNAVMNDDEDDERYTWSLSDWDWEEAQRQHEAADEAYLWRDRAG